MVRSSYVFLTAVIVGVLCAPPAFAEDVTVPDVVGLSLDEATGLLEQAGFKPTIKRVPGAVMGKVVSQEPGGLATRGKGGAVSITVIGPSPKPDFGTPPGGGDPDGPPAGSGDAPDLGTPPAGEAPPGGGDTGPADTDPGDGTLPGGRMPSEQGPEVPGVLGQQTRQAQAAMRNWKIVVEYTLGVPTLVGKVVNQRPHAGARLAAGETVVLVVAVGRRPSPQHRSVPQVEGSAWTKALKAVENWGFVGEARSVASSDADRGLVIQQTPLPGSLAVAGSTVRLLVGRGRGAAPMPVEPLPGDPGPGDPPPGDPTPGDPTPGDPAPLPPPESVNLAAPGQQSPPAGESYPYRYGATFTWTAVSGASTYEWELQAEQQSGAWQKVDTQTVTGERYRPEKLDRGRYRWRVRAVHGGSKSAWSTFRRLYMY